MTLIKIVIAVLFGVALGLFLTSRALERTNVGLDAGPWHGAPRDDNGEVDPYGLAATARSGLMPPGSAEGLSFTADTDSRGAKLTASCDYQVSGPIPEARFWTLSLLTPSGFPVADPANRYAFTSSEILRYMDQPVTITVAKSARSGNWLPTGTATSYVLMFRLYDTALSSIGSTFDAATMPKIDRIACR